MPKSQQAGNPPGPSICPGHIVSVIFLCAGALAAGCPSAEAQSARQPAIAIVDGLAPGDFLNIRATPSPTGSIQARLPNGAGVTNFGCAQYDGYDWCKVRTLEDPKVSGWTPERYLHLADNGQGASDAAAPDGSAPPAVAPAVPGNLDARIGSGGGEKASGKAADEKLRQAIIARYGPAYRSALGLRGNGNAAGNAGEAAPAAGAAAADQTAEDGTLADAGIPLPTPRPAPMARSAVASVQAAEKATGEVPCAGTFGQPVQQCKAEITRLGPGVAEVAVTLPEGGSRTIRFRGGKPDGSDSSEPLQVTREGSLNMIRIGKGERFEILDALALGK